MDKKPDYKGPDETVVALGQSSFDNAVGTLVGGAAGAIAGATLHNQERTDLIKNALETHNRVNIATSVKVPGGHPPQQ